MEVAMKLNKEFSYFIGLAQTDGHLAGKHGKKGRFGIELNYKDRDIIKKISKIIDCNFSIKERIRDTNFKKKCHLISLTVCDMKFRYFLNYCGVPYGKKSQTIAAPLHLKKLHVENYIRGLYDGDGSLGFTATKIPFLSITIQSDKVKDFLLKYIAENTGKEIKKINKPKRDNVWNICIYREDAVKIVEKIYTKNCLSIKRKYELAKKIKKWIRPKEMKFAPYRKDWTNEEDKYILNHSFKESMSALKRTEKSVKIRQWRLKQCK